MRSLLPLQGELIARIKKDTVLLFLDFDGTLTAIRRHPRLAQLSLRRKAALRNLARSRGIKTTIISGRALKDLETRIGVPGLAYVGNHGREYYVEGKRGVIPGSLARKKVLKKLAAALVPVGKRYPGIFIEDKGITLSIHLRGVTSSRAAQAKNMIGALLRSDPRYADLEIRAGKKVLEILPPLRWDKGRMVLWLLERFRKNARSKGFAVYIGDDETDEDAFRALRRQALTIRVGASRASAARYYLNGVRQVHDLLTRMAALKK